MAEEIKLLKEQVKNLENQMKNCENHIYILQSDIQYTQKSFQLEQTKAQSQMTNLASMILDIMKESRQYEEQRENTILQKINNIMSTTDEYGSLNVGAGVGVGVGVNVNPTTIGNDTDSLIDSTMAGLAQNGGQATQAMITSGSARMGANDQLLSSQSIPQPQLMAPGSQIHQLQQATHIAAAQQSFQQIQQQSRQQRVIQQRHIQEQQRQRQQQAQQQQQRHHQQDQQQQQRQTPVLQQQQKQHKRQKNLSPSSGSTDSSLMLDNPMSGVNPAAVSAPRHLPLGMGPRLSSTSTDNVTDDQVLHKERRTYDKEYAFVKAPTTVEEIWNEYAIGFNGQPSIKDLETEYHTGWRRDPATSKKFNRRKAIYNAIEKGRNKGFTVDECIRLLEDYRYLDGDKNLKQPIGWLCLGNLPPELKP